MSQQVEGPATAEEADAVDRLEAQLVVDVDRHDLALPAGQPVPSGGREAAEHAAFTGMEDREPLPLGPGQLAGHRADDARGAFDPASRVALVAHPVPVDPVPTQLPEGDHAVL